MEKGRGLMFFISVFFPGIIKGPDQSEKTSLPGQEGWLASNPDPIDRTGGRKGMYFSEMKLPYPLRKAS